MFDHLAANNASLARDEPRQHPCTAHVPGGGPPGATCLGCAELHQTPSLRRNGRGRCLRWRNLRHLGYLHALADGWRRHPSIPANLAACKYFRAAFFRAAVAERVASQALADHADGTTTVPLTQGLFAIVDTVDRHRVAGRLWHAKRRHDNKFMAATQVDQSVELMHRVVLAAAPGQRITARDGDFLNCRRSNLLLAPRRT